MKSKVFVILILTLAVNINLKAQGKNLNNYSAVTEFDPARNPEQDIKDAVAEAQRTNRRIILDIGGNWCIWCHRIDDFINGNKDVSSLMHSNFLVVKVSYSPENNNEKFLSGYPKIPGYPHFFVLDKNGKLLHSQDTGKLEKGKGYDKDKFTSFLNKWKPEKNQKTM
jgi:thioredoxin-related protein